MRAASGGDLGVALGPSLLGDAIDSEESEAGGWRWGSEKPCTQGSEETLVEKHLCIPSLHSSAAARHMSPQPPPLPRSQAGSVSSEGSLSLDEHEALVAAAEDDLVVSGSCCSATHLRFGGVAGNVGQQQAWGSKAEHAVTCVVAAAQEALAVSLCRLPLCPAPSLDICGA